MRQDRTTKSSIDALDLAALWPCCAQIAGPSLPPIEAAGRSGRTLAADPMGERGDIGLSQCGRGSHGSISGRACGAAR